MAPEAMRVMLRVFARAEGGSEVRRIGARLREALQAFETSEERPPQRYWKMPELYEFSFDLKPALASTFDAVVARAAGGWTHVERDIEFNSVWNAGRGSEFLAPEVTWAEVWLARKARAYVLYLRANQLALSRESVGDWRDLQALHDDYMASLGPWTLDEITDHFATQFGEDETAWPLSRERIGEFMTTGSELVLKAVSRT